MTGELSVDDVLARPPSTFRMVCRALALRCPRCGASKQFHRWFGRRDHCPGCGYAMEHRQDFFFGAYLLNLCVSFAALFGVLIAMVIFEAAENPLPMGLAIGVGLFCAIGLPVVFYPFSFTLWAVVDLHSDPLQLQEIADAVDNLDADDVHEEPVTGASPR